MDKKRSKRNKKNMATEWFVSLGDEKVKMEFAEVSVIELANEIVWIGDLYFYGLDQDDQILRSISNRWTWVINLKI